MWTNPLNPLSVGATAPERARRLTADAFCKNRYRPPMAEPARWGLRRRLLDAMDGLHLARPAVRLYELALAARAGIGAADRASDSDGLPLPPARLRAQIGPLHADPEFFLRSGRSHADLIRNLLREQGSSIDEVGALLDWGCGCGRVLRHWRDLRATGVFGCDIDGRMVDWCRKSLPFAEVAVTGLTPPLPYPDSTFGLVYAFSVFTHLAEDLQHAWMRECLRVLAPEGYLLVSTLGQYYASLDRLTEAEREAFSAGEVVVLYERAAGTSLCSAYHPPEYVHRRLAADFQLVAFRPAGDDGGHDIHLLRRPAPVAAGS
jgi:SAM-dependent methyltransferase